MAREDIYQPQLGPGTSVALPSASPDAFGAGIGEAVQQLGGALERRHDVDVKLAADQQLSDFNARSAAARAEADKVSIDARNAMQPGAAGHSKAMDDWWTAKREALLTGVTNPQVRRAAEQQLNEFGARFSASEYQFEAGARVGKQVSDFQSSIDISANRARLQHDEKAYSEEIGAQLQAIESSQGIPADTKDKLRKYAEQGITIGYLNGLNETNPKAAITLIDAGAYSGILTPQQLDQARNGAMVEVRRVDAEAQQQFNVAKSAANAEVGEILQMGRDGQPLSQAQLGRAGALIEQYGIQGKDYDLEKIRAENAVRIETQRLLPPEIAERRNALAVAVAKAGTNATPKQVAALAEYDRRLGERRSQMANDPYAFAAKAGLSVQPLNLSDPASIRARKQVAATLSQAAGMPVSLLQPDEARVLSAQARGGPALRNQVAGQLSAIGGPDALRAAQQVAPSDYGLQQALAIDPKVREQIFQGEDLRKGNAALAPAKAISDAFTDEVGAALGQTPAWYRNGVLYNAGNLYAYLAAQQGKAGAEDFDGALYRKALTLAVDDTGKGGIGKYSDNKVLLPHGWAQGDFDRFVARIGKVNGFLHGDKTPIDVVELKRSFYPVASARPGQYYWRNKRGEFAVDRHGNLAEMAIGGD